jgi:predicted signal transduction protein with EAL and GGDEF domain
MITMGRSLHLRVVAEGIETRHQLAFLTARNCPEGQGYYFSRPVAADEFAVLLSRRFLVGPASAPEAPLPQARGSQQHRAGQLPVVERL